MDKDLIKVGSYKNKFNQKLKIDLPCLKIYQSKGLAKHIEKRHPECLKYLNYVSDIINSPDYIGTNPKEPNSIELIKTYEKNIQIAIKLNVNDDYYYIATLFDINFSKLQKRLKTGRIKKF